MRLFDFFEHLLEPTAHTGEAPPPTGLAAFYWHYARQAGRLVVALFVAGFVVALLDASIPVFIGQVVTLVSTHVAGRSAAGQLAETCRHGGGAADRCGPRPCCCRP